MLQVASVLSWLLNVGAIVIISVCFFPFIIRSIVPQSEQDCNLLPSVLHSLVRFPSYPFGAAIRSTNALLYRPEKIDPGVNILAKHSLISSTILAMALISNGATTYQVSTPLEIRQVFHFIPDAFEPSKATIAELYKQWGRCLALVDHVVYDIYGAKIRCYFEAHNVKLTMRRACITEDGKDIEKALEVCGWMRDFELVRREPPLVIGGGLVTDVVGSVYCGYS